MTNPKISVIVPIYKVEKYLMQCIDSILAQTLKDIEVILVDEGDLDECRAIIDMYEFGPKKDERVKTLHEKNGGYGASCNKGFDIARGEYISIIESDDFIESTMYEEMYAYAKKLDADVVKTPYYEYFDEQKEVPERINLCFWYAKTQNIPENCLFSIEEQPILVSIHPSIWSALYKTDYIKQKNIRCIEAKGAGYVDNHFRIQTLCQTNKIAWLNKAFNYYRLTNPNASKTLYSIDTFIQRWNDVHNLYENNFQKKYNKIASYSIQEEWLNTFERIFIYNYCISETTSQLLKKNLSYTEVDAINNSTILTKKAKKWLIKSKRNPKIIDKYIISNADCTNLNKTTIKNKPKYSFMIKIKWNKLIIHLFKGLNFKIFEVLLSLGNIFNLNFCIGKK